jgi:amphi-Trp domain-containing protein
MDREVVLFKSEEKKSSLEIASILRQIADKIEEGSMIMGQNDNRISLDFPRNMTMEIKVKQVEKARTMRSLEIELEWIIEEEEQGGLGNRLICQGSLTA